MKYIYSSAKTLIIMLSAFLFLSSSWGSSAEVADDETAIQNLLTEYHKALTTGDMAYGSFIFHIFPKGDPSKSYGSGRGTAILINEQKGWSILHLHTS